MSRLEPRAWRVVSAYKDGGRIIESPRYMSLAHAEEAAERVRGWRRGRDEVLRVVVEECEP